jgi:hypothetical protein
VAIYIVQRAPLNLDSVMLINSAQAAEMNGIRHIEIVPRLTTPVKEEKAPQSSCPDHQCPWAGIVLERMSQTITVTATGPRSFTVKDEIFA